MSHAVLTEFWSWFAVNAEEVRRAYNEGDTEWLNDQLSRWLRSYSDVLSWEIGPYHDGVDTLVISPRTRAGLPLTRRLVAFAPELQGWRFEHAKPRKLVSQLSVQLHGETYSAANWTYRMTTYNKGEFVDIEVFIPAREAFDTSHGSLLCEVIADTLLGEELRLERVGRIEHHVVDAPGEIPRTTRMSCLYDHLVSAVSA